MFYFNLRETLNSRPLLIPTTEDLTAYITDSHKDWYSSLYLYSEKHLQILKDKGTLAGIQDTTTNRMYFDLDDSKDIEAARQDAIGLAHYLVDTMNVDVDKINAFFSGKKGFSLEFLIDSHINPENVRSMIHLLSERFPTLDKKVVDPNRIVRIPNTKHQSSGYYKIPLELYELEELTVNEILKLAEKQRFDVSIKKEAVVLAKTGLRNILETKPVKKEKPILESKELDYNNKPKFLTNCRWSLQNGFFPEGVGIRNNAFLCLASTYKNLGFDVEHVYRLLKGVAELQSRNNNCERYSDEELYNNIVTQVFKDSWQNGQFTCKKPGWLKDYCDALGEHSCGKSPDKHGSPRTFIDLGPSFKHFVKNIDQNTVKTGFQSVDDLVFITTGSNVGLIGAPGSGKTSIALSTLNHTSKAGVKSVFASLDMSSNRMFEKVCYHLTGLKRQELYALYQTDQEEELEKKLKEEFGNVNFFQKSCPTVSDVREYIIECERESGQKVKLVMLDYFERITSDMSDDTQASKRIAGELQDMVNDLDVALITIVQPNKNGLSGGVDAPIYDYTKIKGSSFLYQSFRQIISIWRPGYSPTNFNNDKFLQMAVLKNDLGELGELNFNWHGPTGKISEMEPHQEQELETFLASKDLAKNGGKGDNNGWEN